MNTNHGDESPSGRGDLLFLLGRVAWRLVQIAAVTAGVMLLISIAIPKFDNTKEKAYIAAMKSDLRNLVTAQEAYFADHNTYAASFDTSWYRPSIGVTITIEAATSEGFRASATHKGTPYGCGIFVGRVAPPTKGARPGQPICWKGKR